MSPRPRPLPALRLPRMALSACLWLLACHVPAWAGPPVTLDVVDRHTGQWLPAYPHRGQHWVAGTPGHPYALRLTNTTAERVLVVVSVDGINAISGETAAPGQTGYVLAPWQSTEISGWRKSLQQTARFVFTDRHDSYAARTGRPDQVGVIGIAVFEERRLGPPVARMPEARSSREAARSPAAEAADSSGAFAQERQALSTGHGAREWSPVATTTFQRASQPVQLTELRYGDYTRLVRRGIVPRSPYRDRPQRAPQAFPGHRAIGFVPDPR